jgi:hypothetical protein
MCDRDAITDFNCSAHQDSSGKTTPSAHSVITAPSQIRFHLTAWCAIARDLQDDVLPDLDAATLQREQIQSAGDQVSFDQAGRNRLPAKERRYRGQILDGDQGHLARAVAFGPVAISGDALACRQGRSRRR